MIVIVGLKTRSIISMRVKDLIVAKEVRKLATWGGGKSPPVLSPPKERRSERFNSN
jgi:hypothetical protein